MKKDYIDKIIEAMPKHKCLYCNGDGYTSEHDDNSRNQKTGEHDCSGCPVQVQCEHCHAEGSYITIDVLRTALSGLELEEDRWSRMNMGEKLVNWDDNEGALTDLLRECRNMIVLCALIDRSGQCEELANKVDKIMNWSQPLP